MKSQSLLEGNENEHDYKKDWKYHCSVSGGHTYETFLELLLDDPEFYKIWCTKASPPPSSILPEGDGAEFLKYVSEAREGFSSFILSLPFDNALRTRVDDILICFDQMAERLKK